MNFVCKVKLVKLIVLVCENEIVVKGGKEDFGSRISISCFWR